VPARNLVNLHGASKGYGSRSVLSDVTLGINEGERIGVVGDNGAGKSTLMRLLGGAETPDAGAATHTSGLHAVLVSQRVARGMVQRGSGKIINIGSVQSQLARPGIAPYSATKGGIVMLTKGLCADLGPHGIQTNALAPGYFETELTQALVENEQFTQWVTTRTPAGRWGKVEDLVGALVFLASPASNFVNGQVLFVDGGMTAVV